MLSVKKGLSLGKLGVLGRSSLCPMLTSSQLPSYTRQSSAHQVPGKNHADTPTTRFMKGQLFFDPVVVGAHCLPSEYRVSILSIG